MLPGAPAGKGSRGVLKVLAVVVATVLILGGGGFFALHQLHSNATGAASPGEAVTSMSSAIEAQDPVRALTFVAPAQVRGISDVYKTAKSKASAAGVIGSNPFAGLDISIRGVTTRVDKLSDTAAAVTVTGGNLDYTVNEKQMKPALRAGNAHGEVDLTTVAEDAIGSPAPIITIKQDGKWYVSPADTALEWFRRANSLPAGDFSGKITTSSTGSASPSDVLKDLASAVSGVQASRLLDLVSPDELGAAYRYRRAIIQYLDDQGVLGELQDQGRLTFDDVTSDVRDKSGSSARVVLRSLTGTYSSNDSSGRFSFDGGCLRVDDGSSSDSGCVNKVLEEYGAPTQVADSTDVSVDVVKVSGRWYLSPVRTLARLSKTVVAGLGNKDVLSLLGAESQAPSEGALTTTPRIGSFTSSHDFHVFTVPAVTGKMFKICDSDDNYYDVVGPDGKEPSFLSSGVFRATATGDYKVIVRGDGKKYSVAAAPLVPVPARVGSRLSGTVPESTCGAKVYSLTLAAHQTVLISSTSSPDITDARGNYVGGSSITATTRGTYLLVHASSGSYADRIDAVPAGTLVAGASRRGVVTGGASLQRLLARAGNSYTVTVSGGAFDGVLDVFAPNGTVAGHNDDTIGHDPQVSFTASTTGLYTLRVTGYQGSTGSYVISVS